MSNPSDTTATHANEDDSKKNQCEVLARYNRSHVALHPKTKKMLLNLILNESAYSFSEAIKKIELELQEHNNIEVRPNSQGDIVSYEMYQKNLIQDKLLNLNKELIAQLNKTKARSFTNKTGLLPALYPSPSFLHYSSIDEISLVGEPPVESKVFTSTPYKLLKNISVTPPATPRIYILLSRVFKSTGFLTHATKSNSSSTWSKYNLSRSTPTSKTWGLLLLTLGLHPIYELKLRKNTNSLSKNKLFNDLFPNWENTFNLASWEKIKDLELQQYTGVSDLKLEIPTVAQVKEELHSELLDWYDRGQRFRHHKSAQDVINEINSLHMSSATNKAAYKQIVDMLHEMVSKKIFNKTRTQYYAAGFSQPIKLPNNIIKEIKKNTKIASRLILESNPNPNIYIMLRALFDGKTLHPNHISEASGISFQMWNKYEQGVGIPNSSAWTALIASMDIHPIYTIERRKEEASTEKVFNIFKLLHQRIERPSVIVDGVKLTLNNELHIKETLQYKAFCDQYLADPPASNEG